MKRILLFAASGFMLGIALLASSITFCMGYERMIFAIPGLLGCYCIWVFWLYLDDLSEKYRKRSEEKVLLRDDTIECHGDCPDCKRLDECPRAPSRDEIYVDSFFDN